VDRYSKNNRQATSLYQQMLTMNRIYVSQEKLPTNSYRRKRNISQDWTTQEEKCNWLQQAMTDDELH